MLTKCGMALKLSNVGLLFPHIDVVCELRLTLITVIITINITSSISWYTAMKAEAKMHDSYDRVI